MAIDQITTGVIKDDAVTAAKIPAGAVVADIATGAITTAKLAADAVDGTKIADNAVNSEHVTNGSIDLAHLSADSVDGAKIVDDAIDSEHYAAGSIDTAHIADDQVTGAKIEDNPTIAGNLTVSGNTTLTGDLVPSTPLSHRNMIINGGCIVAQRGISSTAANYQTVDRWGVGFNAGSITQSQSNVASGTDPYALGFRKALKITNGAAVAGAGHYVSAFMYLEAQSMATCGWNYTSSNSYITLSFWIKSSVAGTFYGKVTASDASKEWIFPFTLLANTWKKVTQSFPGHASLQFDMNVERGFEILIPPFYGTDFTASTTTGVWAGYSGAARFPDMVQWGASSGATWEITGVQLELGSNATPFEHRTFGDEYRKCQRYYEKSYDYDMSVGNASENGMIVGAGMSGTATTAYIGGYVTYMTEKRIESGTLTIYDQQGNSGKCSVTQRGISTNHDNPISPSMKSTKGFFMDRGSGDNSSHIKVHFTYNCEL